MSRLVGTGGALRLATWVTPVLLLFWLSDWNAKLVSFIGVLCYFVLFPWVTRDANRFPRWLTLGRIVSRSVTGPGAADRAAHFPHHQADQ